jgi:alkaline phosphatase
MRVAFSLKGNNMKNNFAKKVLVGILALFMVAFSVAFVGCNADLKVVGSAKNVILLIGDGMGLEHLEAVKAYYGLESLNMETLTGYHGEATTNSLNIDITDSSAASTALSCGQKTNNKSVARLEGEDLENMAEYVTKYNMDMGIVVTEGITGGTPASFASHAYDRSNGTNIFNGYMTSGVDLFISQYDETILNERRMTAIGDAGYTYLSHQDQLVESAYNHDKIFATVDEFNGYEEVGGADLAGATTFAMNYLKQRTDNGFFLMVESSHIDKHCHKGDFQEMAEELVAFDLAVKAAIEWAKADGNTMVIVTADHETGGLVYDSEADLSNPSAMFKTKEHSATNVGVFIYGLNPDDLKDVTVIDNTDICKIIRGYIANSRND